MDQKTVETGAGIVKAVPSGDTVVVVQLSRATNGPPPEREISLSGVRAPRIGREGFGNQQANEDKPFAWQAREFLRKKCIGKRVTFTIEHAIPDSNRGFGCVFLASSNGDAPENLIEAGVAAGWLNVTGRENRPDVQALMEMQKQAQAQKLGQFCGIGGAAKKSIRPVYPNVDQYSVYDKLRGRPLVGVVQEIRSGSMLRIVLPEDDFIPIQLQLSGVQCPGYKKDADGVFKPEPFAREAKFFLEQAILNRDVTVQLYGIDKHAIYGSVEYAKRDVALEVLKSGLGWYVGWSGAKLPLAEQYQKAQAEAGAKKLRYWAMPSSQAQLAGKAASSSGDASSKSGGNKPLPGEFNARVCEIVNGSAIRVEYGGQQHLISFASVRAVQAPRHAVGGGRRDHSSASTTDADDDNDAPAPSAQQSARTRLNAHVSRTAKEWLRSRLIGQKVTVKRDYARIGRTSAPDKIYYTVVHKKENVAAGLIEQGLATVIEHGAQDDRSFAYDELVQGEARAKKARRGVYAKADSVPHYRVIDLTTPDAQLSDKQRTTKRGNLRKFFSSLQRRGPTPGVVEWVINPTKLKVYIPKENIIVMVTLAGVRTPRASDTSQFPEAGVIAERALAMSKHLALQRDCTVDVYQVQERGGSLLGAIEINRKDLGVQLLDRGLAHCAGARAARATEYQTAEKHAQLAKKGLWRKYDPEAEAAAAAEAAKAAASGDAAPRQSEMLDVVVTEIVDGATLYMQVLGDGTTQLEAMMAGLRTETLAAAAPATIKKGDVLCGQFTVDDTWYRARVEAVRDDDQFEVRYVDYGNSELLPRSRLRPLPANGKYSATALEFQARLAKLAFLKVPALDEDYGVDAARTLRDLAFGRKLVAAVESKRDGLYHVSLGDPSAQVHVNASMLAAGVCVLQSARNRCSYCAAPLLAKLKAEQESARAKRKALWMYGDVDDDDEEDRR